LTLPAPSKGWFSENRRNGVLGGAEKAHPPTEGEIKSEKSQNLKRGKSRFPQRGESCVPASKKGKKKKKKSSSVPDRGTVCKKQTEKKEEYPDPHTMWGEKKKGDPVSHLKTAWRYRRPQRRSRLWGGGKKGETSRK